jgi:Ca-activated chloride channel family protein
MALLLGTPATAKQVTLDVALANPVILAGEKQTGYLRVAMTGFEMDDDGDRTPVNVAIVLDKSGSMQGDKIVKAREAAIMAVERLRPNDIVSIITYDSTVSVLVPATKASDKHNIIARIRQIQAGGNTALFAGVSKAAYEVRKFLDINRVNRVILMSDGLANEGPSTPAELAELGKSLGQDGIAVTTIGLGLGYNEDLMTQLAGKSDGNHMFAENATDLARAFNQEFGDVLSVVAQNVDIHIHCPAGIRPIRVIGRDADIAGQHVNTSLNQLYSKQMKYVLLEVELPPGTAGQELQVANVDISYANMGTKTRDKLQSLVSAAYSASPDLVAKRLNKKVMESAVEQIGVDNNLTALKLRDEGKVEEARQVLNYNSFYLRDNAVALESKKLHDYSLNNRVDASNLDAIDWVRQRKIMKQEQYKQFNQMPGGANVLYKDGHEKIAKPESKP